jgi:hypothetical protein
MKTPTLILAVIITTLTGCATQPKITLTEQKMRMVGPLLNVKASGVGSLIMEVPSANNFISNQMIVASLKAGVRSNAVEDLVEMLKRPKSLHIAVMSDSDGVAAATIERVLKDIQGANPESKLYFVGEASYVPALSMLANTAGVRFEGIPYP